MKKHAFPKHATSSELSLGRTRNPSLKFWIFDFPNKVRYILGVVALLEACDVTNNGRHLGHHLGFYQELEIRLKLREMVIFCAVHEK